ncbi:MAG: hypothetical protein ACOX6T_05140 [Myxococcales bacterium]
MRSGRWSLARKGKKNVLRYQPPKSDEEVSFEVTDEQLAQIRPLAKKGNAGGVRDVVLTPEARVSTLTTSGVSSVIAANTWRWALPLFGGPAPAEHAKPGRRKPKFLR